MLYASLNRQSLSGICVVNSRSHFFEKVKALIDNM